MKELFNDSLWTDYDPISNMGLPLGRRLTVARGSSGQLVVFSPLRATEHALVDLKRLGEICAFVLPSRFHDLFYDEYFDRFSNARFIAGPASISDHPKWRLSPITPDLPELTGFRYLVLRGMPNVHEHVFLHEASKTLILADSVFNLSMPKRRLTRILMRLADIGGRPRPSRLFRLSIRSRPEFTASLREMLTWDFDRIVGGHGEVIETDGKKIIESAFSDFLKTSLTRR